MAEFKLLSLRMALNHALGGFRTGFGLFPAPTQVTNTEVESFISRLGEVLQFETVAIPQSSSSENFHSTPAEAATQLPQAVSTSELAVAPALESASLVETAATPVVSIDPALPRESAQQTVVETAPVPKRSRKSTSKGGTAKKTATVAPVEPLAAGESAPARKRKAKAPRDPAAPAKPRAAKRKAIEPQEATLVSTAMVHIPKVKLVPATKLVRRTQPLPELMNPGQAAAPVYQHAPKQIQAQTLADQPPPRQKKTEEGSDLSPFSVSVGQVYDGPLDLLLDLIRRQDIDIYDIPIATITAQFLSYVNQLKASDVDVAGEFIYTASLLIHIKSKMLLPRSPSGPDDAPEDPRRELVERLLEHERFKNAAQMLQQKQMLEAATWSNPGFREFQGDVDAEPEIAADTVDLVRIFRDILDRARQRPVLDVEEDSATVGQMMQFLARRLSIEDKPIALRRLLSNTRSERALVAIFLALLELVRLQAILLRQDRAFSEIFIKKQAGFDAVMNEGLTNAQDDWR
jgi:segregation and condensation protein A